MHTKARPFRWGFGGGGGGVAPFVPADWGLNLEEGESLSKEAREIERRSVMMVLECRLKGLGFILRVVRSHSISSGKRGS